MKRSYYISRILLCALVILVCLCVIIMSIEVSGRTDERKFRLAEQAQLVGPAHILGKELCAEPWGEVMIGESEYGYTLFQCDSGDLFYHKKAAEFTTFCPATLPDGFGKNDPVLPIIVFTDNTSGVRAKLTVQIFNTHSGALQERHFTTNAQRSEQGYFLFSLSLGPSIGEMFSDFLTEMLNDTSCSWPLTYGTVTLELYDGSGNLLESITHNYYVPDPES